MVVSVLLNIFDSIGLNHYAHFRLNPLANNFCPSNNQNSIRFSKKSNGCLNCVYSNLQGMLEACHIDEFANEVTKIKDVHVCAIAETWLRNKINTNKSVAINGFNIYRSDRIGKKGDHNKGGGVALYVRNNIKCKILLKSSSDNNEIKNAEYIFTEINSKRFTICIIVIYRTNGCNSTDTIKLFNLMIEISSKYDNVIIFGDFNINIINNTNSLKTLNDYFSVVNHYCPTHRWPSADPTLIDIILTKNTDRIQYFSHFNLIPSTHHDLLCVSYKAKFNNLNKPVKFSYRNFNKINQEKLLHDISTLDWSELFVETDIDNKVLLFNTKYQKLFDDNVPLSNVKLKFGSKSWFTVDLINMFRIRKELYDKYKSCNNIDLKHNYYIQYRKQCKEVKNRINYLKREKMTDDVNNAKSNKQKWVILKTTGCSKDKKDISSKNFNVDELNDHFIKLHSSPLQQLPNFNEILPHNSFDFKPIIANDILNAVKNIKSSSVGFDGISLRFLKRILPSFMDAIINIFNHSLQTCTFPEIWNTIIIQPIAKNNNPISVIDTRPITLNSLMTKIFTYTLNNQIKYFVESNNLLSPMQSGFRSYHSCTTALMSVSEDIRINISNNKLTIFVSLDIKSAYSSVLHEIIYLILRANGFSDNALRWFKCFLGNKKQCVRLNNNTSKFQKINCGLLQGDNLSQSLFSLVINNVTRHIQDCSLKLYADDMGLYYEFDVGDTLNAINIINHNLELCNKFITDIGLSFNPKKSHAMIIGSPNNIKKLNNLIPQLPKIRVNNSEIEYVQTMKYLGFNFNKNFDSTNQVDYIIKNVNFILSKLQSN